MLHVLDRRVPALFCALLISFLARQEGEVEETTYPNGELRERSEILRGPDGTAIRHGAYTAWHENGEVSIEGTYENGIRSGRWIHRHPNGKRSAFGRYAKDLRTAKWKLFHENGEKRGEGSYSGGRMSGPWTFWTKEGEPDPVATGVYGYERIGPASGPARCEGPTKNGRLHGRWTFWWAEDQVQFEGEYVDGEREGVWRFVHVDGTYDPGFLSGEYRRGNRVAPGEEAFLAPDESYHLASLETPDWIGPNDRLRSEELLGLASDLVEARRVEAHQELVGLRGRGVPAVFNRWVRLDSSDGGDARLVAGIFRQLLFDVFQGRTFDTRASKELEADAFERLTLLRWHSLWALSSDDSEFWEFDTRWSPADDSEEIEVPFPDPLSMGRDRWFATAEARRIYAPRFEARPDDEATEPIQRGLAWLSTQQTAEGFWDADSFGEDREAFSDHAYNDIGVTSLALLAFMSEGNTTREGPYRDDVLRGVLFLGESVKEDGSLVSLLPPAGLNYDQALAALALSEASAFCPSAALRRKAELAIGWCAKARIPGGAWRQDLPNTSITTWMVHALKAAEWCGLTVDASLYEAAGNWIDKATQTSSGRIGYDGRGTAPARSERNSHYPRERSEAMTAAGAFCRLLLGQTVETNDVIKRHVYRLRKMPPAWDPEGLSCDMYYWHFGTIVLHQLGGDAWEKWWKALSGVAAGAQLASGEEAGSWAPIGPWGYHGGRVYSTATMTLSLQTPHRFAALATPGPTSSAR